MILPGSGVIVYSAVSAAITASMNGASFGEALGYGAISGFAAFAGMQFGSALGGALGLGEFSTGVLAGVAGGAAGGATGAALMGGDVGRATLAGMAGGGIGMAIPYAGAIIGGGVAAEIAGGEFWEGAAGGAAYVVASAITSGAFQAARDVGAKLNKERFASQHKVDQEIVRHALKPPSLTESAEEFNEIVGNLTDTIPHGTTTGNPAADTALKAYSILKSLPKLANKMKSALTTAQDKFISFLNRVGTVGTTKAEQFSKDPNNISDIAIYAPYVSGPIIKHK